MKDSLIVLSLSIVMTIAGCLSRPGGMSSATTHGDDGQHAYITPTDASFDQDVLQSSQPVLVDFTATWCGPCQMLAPSIAELAVEFEGRAKVAKVDVDACPKTAQQYNIEGIPALLFFQDGQVVDRIEGYESGIKDKLAGKLNSLLKK